MSALALTGPGAGYVPIESRIAALEERLAQGEQRIAQLEQKLTVEREAKPAEEPDLLSNREAACLLGRSVSGLNKLRDRDPTLERCFVRLADSPRAPLRWSRRRLERWIAERF